tara:strand:- start:5318 stop:5647 length:330 start_codon:yes stop_codon:yes gene_type:complete
MDNVNPGEIVYCDITYKYKRLFRNKLKEELVTMRNVVFGREYDSSYPYLDYATYSRTIKKINKKKPLTCDVKVIDLQVHARTGFKKINNNFTTVKKNDEQRNNITGAYE